MNVFEPLGAPAMWGGEILLVLSEYASCTALVAATQAAHTKLNCDGASLPWQIRKLVIPKATAVVNYEVEHDFPGLGRRTMLLTARTLHHPDNGGHSMLLSIVDATDRHRRDAAKDMLFGELRHRMKNLLAVAQSIARQTTTKGRSAEEYRDDFLGRFGALVEAQDLAFAEQEGAGLEALIERSLVPYTANAEAVVIEPGAAVALGPSLVDKNSAIFRAAFTSAPNGTTFRR